MNDRDRTAPVTLTGDTPVTQPVGHGGLTDTGLFQPGGNLGLGFSNGHAIKEVGVSEAAVPCISSIADRECGGIDIIGNDDGKDRQVIFQGEVEIPLVMCRTAEDSAGAIFHQDKVGDINRQLNTGTQRMTGENAGGKALFLGLLDIGFAGAHAVALSNEAGEIGI